MEYRIESDEAKGILFMHVGGARDKNSQEAAEEERKAWGNFPKDDFLGFGCTVSTCKAHMRAATDNGGNCWLCVNAIPGFGVPPFVDLLVPYARVQEVFGAGAERAVLSCVLIWCWGRVVAVVEPTTLQAVRTLPHVTVKELAEARRKDLLDTAAGQIRSALQHMERAEKVDKVLEPLKRWLEEG